MKKHRLNTNGGMKTMRFSLLADRLPKRSTMASGNIYESKHYTKSIMNQ